MNNYDDALTFADETVKACGYDPRAAPRPVAVVYLIGLIDFEVTNGGVTQWLTNRSGRYAADTANALDEIGANQCAAIVRKILAFFPGEAPMESDEGRWTQVEELRESAESAWYELGDSLLEWPDDVDALLRKYVEQHASELRG